MQYIDKSSVEGERIAKDFINGQWIDDRYSNLDYPGFSTPKMRKVLIDEQNQLCCYYMRHLEDNPTTTLEHIVPRQVETQAELNHYFDFPVLADNLTLHEPFRTSPVEQQMPPYPHHLAYHNLVASCNGMLISDLANLNNRTVKTCNGVRGNIPIVPIFYDPAVSDKITYAKGGMMVPHEDNWFDTIKDVKLNDNTLEDIRRIWFFLRKDDLASILAVTTLEERQDILTNAMSDAIVNDSAKITALIGNYKNQVMWDSLIKYKWFHGYYRLMFP
jgi:hypothetical protein